VYCILLSYYTRINHIRLFNRHIFDDFYYSLGRIACTQSMRCGLYIATDLACSVVYASVCLCTVKQCKVYVDLYSTSS